MIPGADPLDNRKHEAFALAVACEGLSLVDAYREKVSNKGTDKSTYERGSQLAADIKIASRIAWLRAKATEKAREKADIAVLTKADKLAFCASIVNLDSLNVDEAKHGHLTSGAIYDAQGNKVAIKPPTVAEKLTALKIHNDLAEEGAEASALSGLLARVTGWGHRE